MPTINPFATSDAFNMVSLTMAINRLPIQYGRLGQLGIFPERGVVTRSILIDERFGKLNLLQTRAPGSPPSMGAVGKRKTRSFDCPHNPHADVVLPSEVNGIRAFGSENAMVALADKLMEKLATMRAKHDQTKEYRRFGALSGILLDADATELSNGNLFTQFGVSQKTVSFELDVDGTDVRGLIKADVLNYMDLNIGGDTRNGAHALCGADFFQELTNHPTVLRAWDNQQGRSDMLGVELETFNFGGITFEQHLGRATHIAEDGTETVRQFIADTEALIFPKGTNNMFAAFNAPAEMNDAVGRPGQPIYAKQEPMKFERGTDLYTESNYLPMNARPELVVKATLT